MRSVFSSMPMLRVMIALIAGIGIYISIWQLWGIENWMLIAAAVMLAIVFVLIVGLGFINNVTTAYRLRHFNYAAVVTALVSLGFLTASLSDERREANHFANYLAENNVYHIEITEPPTERANTISAVGTVVQVVNAGKAWATDGKVQLSFLKDSLSQKLQYGDLIVCRAGIDTFDEPANPYQFDYRSYESFRNIYYRSFLKNEDWKLTATSAGNPVLAFTYQIREHFAAIIKQYVIDQNDLAVAGAIMLGYRDYVNGGPVWRAYTSSGTLHVLSVSGLHVGIMFLMLNFLLGWADKRGTKPKIAKAVFIIVFIWFYAGLTGLSPPVLRSAMMFSLIQVGLLFKRNVNTFNVVAASAVVLLVFNPFVITDVGFQLSYVAVFGILYLYPKISKLVLIKQPGKWKYKKEERWYAKPLVFLRNDLPLVPTAALNWLWQLTAVSLAAQIATLPLSLFYFYQFPNLFLLSNLVVIPLSNLVLFSGTALFAFGHIPFLNVVSGFVFSGLLHVLDAFIFWVDKLPFALTSGITIGVIEMAIMYVLIGLISWITESRRPKLLIASLVLIVALCSFQSYRSYANEKHREIIVYSVYKHRAIAFISSKQVLFDFDNELWNDPNAMAFNVWHHWWNCGIKKELPVEEAKENVYRFNFGKIVLFEGKRIGIVDSVPKPTEVKLKVDALIVSGNPKLHLQQLQNAFDFDLLILDTSNKPYLIKRLRTEALTSNINCYDVKAKGAYRLQF